MLKKKKLEEIERLKQWLKRTEWPPMSYMLIPSVLNKADAIIDELKDYQEAVVVKLRDELIELRKDFKREK